MSEKSASYLDKLFGLEGRTAVVTGGNRGIGQVVARGLASAGAEVVVISRSGGAETVKLILEDGNKAYDIKADVTDEKSVDRAVEEIEKRSGGIHVLFNNAGICIHKSTFEASIEEFRQVVDVNLTGEYIMARSAARLMVQKKIHGSIINMASMSGTIVNIPQWQASYNASKAGVIQLTKSMAIEFAKRGVRVNCISPGYMGTELTLNSPSLKPLIEQWNAMAPMGRMGRPEELQSIAVYLAGDTSSFTTGSDFIVDGAFTCF